MTPFWPVGHARGVGIEGALGKVSLFTRKWTSGSAFPSYHSMLFHFWVSRWATLHPSCFPKEKSLKIQLMLRTAEQSLGGPWTGGITELLDVWTFPSMKFKPVWADVFCLMKLKSFWQVLLLMEPLMAIIFILEFFPGIPPWMFRRQQKMKPCISVFTDLPPPMPRYTVPVMTLSLQDGMSKQLRNVVPEDTLVWEDHPRRVSP